MQLTQKTDYALRTLLFLAITRDRLSTLSEIAEKFNISREHLVKIVGKLAKINCITTLRGKGGGLKINESTLELTLYEIVMQFEGTLDIIDCDHLLCPVRGVCRLKLVLNEATNSFAQVLKSYRLIDLLPKTKQEIVGINKKLSISIKLNK